MKNLTIVTGLSGSGKSVALHSLEDEGFYCIDNLPSSMVMDLLENFRKSDNKLAEKVAIGIDMRGEQHTSLEFLRLIHQLKSMQDLDTNVLFLDTARGVLSTRFSETRRKHPLSSKDVPLINAIDKEIRLLESIKNDADLVIDTTELNLHQLRHIIREEVMAKTTTRLLLTFQSFGFKHGAPASTDFMFDVRCLPNPFWEPQLREFDGRQQPIIDYLEAQPDVADMFNDIRNFVARWLPVYEKENRAYLTVSVGCTGGKHRSVYLCEKLVEYFSANRENVAHRHRELTQRA